MSNELVHTAHHFLREILAKWKEYNTYKNHHKSTPSHCVATATVLLCVVGSLLEEASEQLRSAGLEGEDGDLRDSRHTRSATWMTSNMSSRSVVPPGYDMLEKPPSPTPGEQDI